MVFRHLTTLALVSLICACHFDETGLDQALDGDSAPGAPLPDATPAGPSDAQADAAQPVGCPPDAVQRAGICLRHAAPARTWTQAQAACVDAGGRLAVLDAASTVELATSAAPPNSVYWIGAREGADEGTWAWVDGRPFVFTAWGPNQPNDAASSEDQDCLVVRNASRWFDDDCATPQASMCEWVIEP